MIDDSLIELKIISAILLAGILSSDNGSINSMVLPAKAISLAQDLINQINQMEK